MPLNVPFDNKKAYDLKIKLTEPKRYFEENGDSFIHFKGVLAEVKKVTPTIQESPLEEREHVFYRWRYSAETKIVEASRGIRYLFEEPST